MMEKKRSVRILTFLLLLAYFVFPAFIFAETIIFKDGKKAEGKIIEKTDEYMKVNVGGIVITYPMAEIESVEEEKNASPFKIEPVDEITSLTVSEGNLIQKAELLWNYMVQKEMEMQEFFNKAMNLADSSRQKEGKISQEARKEAENLYSRRKRIEEEMNLQIKKTLQEFDKTETREFGEVPLEAISGKKCITQMSNAIKDLKSYKDVFILKSETDQPFEMVTISIREFVRPDKIHMRTMQSGGIVGCGESYWIGNTVYERLVTDQKWTKRSISEDEVSALFITIKEEEEGEVEVIGEAEIEGNPCWVLATPPSIYKSYKLGADTEMGIRNMDSHTWIDKKSFYPRRLVLKLGGEVKMQGEGPITVKTKFFVEISDFNAPFSIKAPQ